ncbi:MAG: hypothetical protein ACYCT7_05560 [bacterium]
MSNIKNMTMDDLEQFIEYKLIEIIGNPDSGLKLKKEFKVKLEERLKKTSKRIPGEEVIKKIA